MQIVLNGDTLQLPRAMSIAQLLVHLGHGERRVAVEVNREIVPRSRHADHMLQPDDRVELVQAMGGG